MMAYPPAYREVAPALPSIIVPGGGRYSTGHHDMPFGRSPAMAIPGLERHEYVPPPLPPPPEPFGKTSYRSEDLKRERREYTHGSFASGYGSIVSSFADERPSLKRADTASTNGDEGYASLSSTESQRSLPSLPKYHFQSAADIHCFSMKKKLDPIRTFDKSPPRTFLTTSVNDLGPLKESHLAPPPSLSVQLPIHSRTMRDSRQSSFASASSPRSSHLPRTPLDHRSPIDGFDFERSPRARTRNNSDATSRHGSYDYHAAEDMELDDHHHVSFDSRVIAGQKRRAVSPAPDDHLYHSPHSNHTEALRRRETSARVSPTSRLSTIPQGNPLSPRGIYMSNISIPGNTASSTTYSHRSPPGPSPTTLSSPYTASTSLNPSRRNSITRAPMHSRVPSGASPRKVRDMKGNGHKLQGFFMCECCPKKPKKFESAAELSAHEAEKQYECSYCGNRFKNKNEAERHQNSLHVRRHSWSCSALTQYDRAFHDSATRPGEVDACGYCGDEFARSGRGPGNGALNGGIVPRHATEADWEERVRHLEEVHKFRECNSSKKFYRADHFRQHLKHSHAGTSGKWTNMLENACLLEEEPSPR